ncbi:MAG: FABP family protein [Acidobacteria bacterium]|nr:FABP family protein [Acidobacteriota bacterium]
MLGSELGPLEGLVGNWEGDQGLDVAYGHAVSGLLETPYRERATFGAFGPVGNGTQQLYGLDYRMSAWRTGEDDPFHTEVGYWLWDGDAGQVVRCFMVPRGSTILAGGAAAASDRQFSMHAELGSQTYGILSNPYLHDAARTTAYRVTVTLGDDGTYAYDQETTIDHARWHEPLAHTDKNVLRRVD